MASKQTKREKQRLEWLRDIFREYERKYGAELPVGGLADWVARFVIVVSAPPKREEV